MKGQKQLDQTTHLTDTFKTVGQRKPCPPKPDHLTCSLNHQRITNTWSACSLDLYLRRPCSILLSFSLLCFLSAFFCQVQTLWTQTCSYLISFSIGASAFINLSFVLFLFFKSRLALGLKEIYLIAMSPGPGY